MANSVWITAGSQFFGDDIAIAASHYLNWGSTFGTNGYGLRDNAGTIEFKGSGGAWAPIAASAGSAGGWTKAGAVVSLTTGTDTIGSNLRPTDATYTLGDSTHRWLDIFTNEIKLSNGASPEADIVVDPDGTLNIYANDAYLVNGFDGGSETEVNDLAVDGVMNTTGHASVGGTSFQSAFQFSVLGTSKFYNAPSTTTADNPLTTIATEFISTGGNATDLVVPLRIATTAGTNAEATKGSIQNISGGIAIRGVGSNTNEYSYLAGGIGFEIGTGYTQTTGPTGAAWLSDLAVMGPISVQPVTLGGWTIVMNNSYNGSPSANPSYAYAAVSYPTFGPGIDAPHIAATTYPIDVGYYVGGKSGTLGSPVGIGFTTAIQVGGAGSNWGVPSSLIGTGIDISQYATAGINIHAATATTAPSMIFDTFLQGAEMTAPSAPAANGFRIFAQDNGGGKTQLMVLFNTGAAQQLAIQP